MSVENEFPRMAACIKFAEQHPEAEYGPTHLVVSDFNTANHFVMRALAEVLTLAAFLTHLMTLPEDDYGDSR